MARKAGAGPLSEHYTTLADESERALTVLGERLAANGAVHGDASG
jgi:two-component system chemotaxis response regulator CheB